MKAVLSETGLVFNASQYAQTYGNIDLLKMLRKYTIRTIDRATKIPHETKIFRMIKLASKDKKTEGVKLIEFPRFMVDKLVSSIPSAQTPISEIDIQLPTHNRLENINYIGTSNPNQKIVVDYVLNKFRSAEAFAGVTLKVAPGLGKSFIAKDIIHHMKLKTLVVVPNTFLLDQWVTLLKQYFPENTIGTLYGKKKTDGDIIVAIVNTMADLNSFEISEKKPWPNIGKTQRFMTVGKTIVVDDILKQIGLTIFDESHKYVSKEFRKVFRRVWSRYTIGLSATPDIREDKLDIIHQMWLGPIIDAETLDGFNAVQDVFTAQAHLIEYHAQNEHCSFNVRENGMLEYTSIIESLINDPIRNQIIVEQIIKLMDTGLYTFVFSDRRSHLEHLYELLEPKLAGRDAILEIPESEKRVILYGGSDENTIRTAKKTSTVVFTTYSYSSTGVSITKMNGLILATPRRSNMTQIIGRVFRLGSDANIKRSIVDIVDAKMPLKAQIRERLKAYKERQCEITKYVLHAKRT